MFILLLLLVSGLPLSDPLSSDDISETELYQNVAYRFTDPIELRRTMISISPVNGDLFLFSREENHRYLTRIRETGEQQSLPFPEFDDPSNKFMDVSRDGRSLLFWDVSVGRVHKMDLETGILERLDNSFTHRNMYYHAPFLEEDGSIYAAGGYGFWEFKNLLTRFDPESGEWKEIRARNRADLPRGQNGMLIRDRDTLHYLVSDYETEARFLSPLEAWYYRPDSDSWQRNSRLTALLAEIQPPFGNNVSGSSIYSTSYSVDRAKGQLAFLSGPSNQSAQLNIVDLRQNRLFKIPVSSFGLNFVFAALYSQTHGAWVLLGISEALASRSMLVARTFRFDPDDTLVTEVTFEKTGGSFAATGGIVLALAFVIGLFLFYRRTSNAQNTKELESKTVLSLHRDGISVKALVNGKDINPEKDDLVDLFTEVLVQMKENGQAEMLTSDLNSQLFNHYPANHSTYFSRNRQKLIRYFNEELGKTFIEERRSRVDKRFKVLSVDLDTIEIEKREG